MSRTPLRAGVLLGAIPASATRAAAAALAVIGFAGRWSFGRRRSLRLFEAGFSAPATRKTPLGKRGLVGWRNSRGAAILRDSANDRQLTFDCRSFQGK
jgi:hypothetical protein